MITVIVSTGVSTNGVLLGDYFSVQSFLIVYNLIFYNFWIVIEICLQINLKRIGLIALRCDSIDIEELTLRRFMVPRQNVLMSDIFKNSISFIFKNHKKKLNF